MLNYNEYKVPDPDKKQDQICQVFVRANSLPRHVDQDHLQLQQQDIIRWVDGVSKYLELIGNILGWDLVVGRYL